MYIKKLYLGHFGKFHDKSLNFEPGLNIVYGKNEAGKSTIHAFIRGMLFGIERARGRASKDDTYTKYEPWETPGVYQGSLLLIVNGEEYNISRSFYKKEKRLQVIQVSTGRELPMDEYSLQNLLHGLTDSVYRNTVSVEQLRVKTDCDLANEMKNYLTNLTMSKSLEVDVNEALNILTEQKKQMEKDLPSSEISKLEQEICEGKTVVSHMEQLTNELSVLITQSEKIKEQLLLYNDAATRDRLEKVSQLPVIQEKYKAFKDLINQLEQLTERVAYLEEKTKKPLGEIDSSEVIQTNLSKLQELRQEKMKYEDEIRQKKLEWEQSSNEHHVNIRLISVILSLLGILICVIPFGNAIIRCTIGIVMFFFGIVQYGYKVTKDEQSIKTMEEVEKIYEREIFQLHSQRHDILLTHRVSNETQLIMKYNDITKSQLEREQLLERKDEYNANRNTIQAKVDALETEIINYMKYFIQNPELSDSCMEELILQTREYRDEACQRRNAYQESLNQMREKMDYIRWELDSNRNKEEEVETKEKRLKQLNQKKSQLEEEIMAIQLSIDTIKELSTNIHDTFGTMLNDAISNYITTLSNREYTRVVVDENLSIKVFSNNHYVAVENLSSGTIDQMYLALRLAVADLLFPESNLPIILDDSFALYDDQRTKEALEMFAKQTNRQIIILTCHQREIEMIQELNISANIIRLSA